MMIEKALGNREGAAQAWARFCNEFGSYEFELERYYDHYMAMTTMGRCVT